MESVSRFLLSIFLDLSSSLYLRESGTRLSQRIGLFQASLCFSTFTSLLLGGLEVTYYFSLTSILSEESYYFTGARFDMKTEEEQPMLLMRFVIIQEELEFKEKNID